MLKNKLPKAWNQITIETFIELRSLSQEDGMFNYQIDVLCTLLDCYPEDFDDISLDELEELLLEVKFIRDEPHKHYKNTIGDYKLKSCLISMQYFTGAFVLMNGAMKYSNLTIIIQPID